jgi:NADPH:quinone reductase-like Zn-dependent oxidoreductase
MNGDIGMRIVVPLLAVLVLAFGANTQAQTTQKQWQLIKTGAQGYELKLAETAVRKPGTGEVLLKMHAASLNRRDLDVMHGEVRLAHDATVPLSDGAGEVVALGADVKRFKVGDKVTPIFFPNWIDGRPSDNARKGPLGGPADGVLTEYLTISEESLVAMPAGLSYEEAATLACAAVTAWNGLVTRGHMQAGDYVLLEGTGGVSLFGLQFAVAAGAKPIITSSSDEKLAKAKALGAIGGVNYKTTAKWEEPVRALTGGVGVQQVLEVGGGDSMQHALATLGFSGHLALIGDLAGEGGGEIPLTALPGNGAVSRVFVGSRENFAAMNTFIAKHHVKPVIDRIFAFEDAEAAYKLMEEGGFFGKIVIRF